jgi:hypothetical protein
MNNETANAYKLGKQLELTKESIASVQAGIRYINRALKFAFATTWLLYFIFAMGFYVTDLFGISTWLAQNTSETVAFSIFFVMAVLMAQTLAMIKHAFYEHKAEFKVAAGVVLVMSSMGVFFEMFNSSSQQQNIAYGKAESSKGYASVANTGITVGSPADGSQLAYYQGEKARYAALASGCKKSCRANTAKVAEFDAKVKATQQSQKDAASTAATATVAAIKAKADTLQSMKDENHKPIFKTVRDWLGVSISSAVVLVALVVSAGFEFCHAQLSVMLGQKLAYLRGLQEQLITQASGYMSMTGKQYDTTDFDGMASNLKHHKPVARDDYKQTSQGFGFIPSTAKGTGNDTAGISPALFKYQQTPQEETKRQPFGFAPTGRKAAQPEPESTVEYLTKVARNAPSPSVPTGQKPGATGLHNPALGTAEEHYPLPLPHGTSTVGSTGAKGGVSHGTSTVADEEGREFDDALYEELKARIVAREIEPMTKPVKQLLKVWAVGRNDDHRQHIAGEAFDRMHREGVLTLNPEQGKFKRKYLLA